MANFGRSPFPSGPELIGDVWKGEWYPAHCYKIPAVAAVNGILQQVGASPTGAAISDTEATLAQLKEYHEQLGELASHADSTQKQVAFFLQCVQSTALALQKQASKRIAAVEKVAPKFKKWFWKSKHEGSAGGIATVPGSEFTFDPEGNQQTSSSEDDTAAGPKSSVSSSRTLHMRSLSYSLSPNTSKGTSPASPDDAKDTVSKTTSFAKVSLPKSCTRIAQSSPNLLQAKAGSHAHRAAGKKDFSLSAVEFEKIMENLVEEEEPAAGSDSKQPQHRPTRQLIGRRSLGAADFDRMNVTAIVDAASAKSAETGSPRHPPLSQSAASQDSKPLKQCPVSKGSASFLGRTMSPGKLLSRAISPGRSASPQGEPQSKALAILRHLSPVKGEQVQSSMPPSDAHPGGLSVGVRESGSGNDMQGQAESSRPPAGQGAEMQSSSMGAVSSREHGKGLVVEETIAEEAASEFEDTSWSDKSTSSIRGIASETGGSGASPAVTPGGMAKMQRARSARYSPSSPMYSVSAQQSPGCKASESMPGVPTKMSRSLSRRGPLADIRGSPAGSVPSMPSSPSVKRLQKSQTMLDRAGASSPLHPTYRGRKSGHERLLEIMSNVQTSWASHPANCGSQAVSAASSPASDVSSDRLSTRLREGSFHSDETQSQASGSEAGSGKLAADGGFPRPPPGPGPKKLDAVSAKVGNSPAKKKQEEMLLELLKAAPPIKWSHLTAEAGEGSKAD